MTYKEKLLDPRWQKKRLEILQRDNFTCQMCGDTKSTLQVHHKLYIKGNDPWEYPNLMLITLCGDCHEHETHFVSSRAMGKYITEYFQSAFLISHLALLIDGFEKLGDSRWDRYTIRAIRYLLSTPKEIKSLTKRYMKYREKQKEKI
jgi:hypothetical protein